MQIDEPGYHGQAGHVQPPLRRGRSQIADGRQPAVAHAHVVQPGRATLAVVDRATAEDGVEHGAYSHYLPTPKMRFGNHTTTCGRATTKAMPKT
jgi:hypothetical protein